MIKKLFKKNPKESLTIVFLDVRRKTMEMITFNDLFDFFNYCIEMNIQHYKTHCYDPKKGTLLVTFNE